MNGAKHPLVRAYEVGALKGTLHLYIDHCIRAITAESELIAQMNLKWAAELEQMISPERIDFGRLVVEAVLGINSEREVKHDALEA